MAQSTSEENSLVMTPASPTPANGQHSLLEFLQSLPPELWRMVLRYALSESWQGKIPGVVHLLRTKETMEYYIEATEIFPTINYFEFDPSPKGGLQYMSKTQISKIEKISFKVPTSKVPEQDELYWAEFINEFAKIKDTSETVNRVRTFHIDAEEFTTCDDKLTFANVEVYCNRLCDLRLWISCLRLLGCPNLNTLTASIQSTGQFHLQFIHRMNYLAGSKGNLEETSTKGDILHYSWNIVPYSGNGTGWAWNETENITVGQKLKHIVKVLNECVAGKFFDKHLQLLSLVSEDNSADKKGDIETGRS